MAGKFPCHVIPVSYTHLDVYKRQLLKRLTELTKLSYISDLHGGASGRIISKALHEIKPEEYSIEEWEYAIGYILGQTQHFESREAALQ